MTHEHEHENENVHMHHHEREHIPHRAGTLAMECELLTLINSH